MDVPDGDNTPTKGDRMTDTTVRVSIQGMTCEGCAQSIQHALKLARGIKAVKVNWQTGQGEVTFDPAETTEADILEHAVFQGHYSACLIPSRGCC